MAKLIVQIEQKKKNSKCDEETFVTSHSCTSNMIVLLNLLNNKGKVLVGM